MRKKSLGKGDIVKVAPDPSIGREPQGFRPGLVLTNREYNDLTGVPLVAPITNAGVFARNNGFSVNLIGTRVQTTGVVRCDQIRSLDLTQREARYVETVPDFIIGEVLEIIGTILEIE